MNHFNELLKNYTPQEILDSYKSSILIIDDDYSIQRGLKTYFSKDYDILVADSALQGLDILTNHSAHCIILDIKMKDMDGFEAYPKLKEKRPDIPIIFYSAFQNEHDLKTILNTFKPEGYFAKGDNIEGLKDTVNKSIERFLSKTNQIEKMQSLQHKLEDEKKKKAYLKQRIQSNYKFESLIGISLPMIKFKKLCEKAVNSDITVLIQGDTGTGKELVANIIHENSSRSGNNFIIQNCATIPENLFESELFGHIKGSFSGAINDRKGVFEHANKGTVFLDEIGELPIAMQVKLLRLIQHGEVRPVGSNKTKYVDVRIVSATNRDLAHEVKKGRFREDLYYRLNVFKLSTPALREIMDDIPTLIQHFINKYKDKHKSSAKKISQRALKVLLNYTFPGNVRELENEIERALIMVGMEGDKIELHHLSDNILTSGQFIKKIGADNKTMKVLVESLEQDLITKAMDKHNGNKTHAAKTLGISRVGLNKKIKRYELFIN